MAQSQPAPAKSQNFENHARIIPAYHAVVFPILVLNLGWSIYGLVRAFSFEAAVGLLVAAALLIIFFYARLFALTVQDRVIRLEMRLRMAQVLPADLRARIPEFSVGQLVALRFAGDAELPELARKVLADNITDRKTIKKMVRDWQPDFLRV